MFSMQGRGDEGSRGVSTVIGAVLLIGLVIAASTLLVATSANTTAEQASELAGETAGTTLERLADSMRAVSTGANPRLEVEIVQFREVQDRIGIISGGSIRVDVGGTTVADKQVDSVGVRLDEATVAYQSGGIWRVSKGKPRAAEIIEAPPATMLQRGNATSISLPIYTVESDGGFTKRVEVVSQGSSRVYPQLLVPPNESVQITVQSQFAAAWKQFFEVSFPTRDRRINYSPSTDTVVVTYEAGRSYNLYLHSYVHDIQIDT